MVSALAPRSRCDVHYIEYRPYSISNTIMDNRAFFKDGTELKDFALFKSITFQLLLFELW